VFERFTERARQVVVMAQDEARALEHNYIGTEHILLGLVRENEGVASRILAQLGAPADVVRNEVGRMLGATPAPSLAAPRGRLAMESAGIPFVPGWLLLPALGIGLLLGWLIWS
jgi:ATP-dependent Clp protease ATP-binding subunit ClpA